MEAVLTNNTNTNNSSQTESRDFVPLNKLPPQNRSKKPKKKKVSMKGSGRMTGSFERFPGYDYTYSGAPRTRPKTTPTNRGSDSAIKSSIPVVEEILKSLGQTKDKLESSEGDGSDKMVPSDDFGSSQEESSPSSGGYFTPSRVHLTEDDSSKDPKPIVIDLNDFDEDDIYIRKNRSNVSLNGSIQDTSPEASGKLQEHCLQKSTSGVQNSPSVSSNRLNFRSANGLLHSSVLGEDPISGQVGGGGWTGVRECENLLVPQLDQGLKTLQTLFQMNSNLPVNHLLPALAQQLPNFQLQSPYPLIQQQQQQLVPQQCVHGVPILQGNGLMMQDPVFEEFRKQKDSFLEDSSCFYYRATNDLDRFLIQTTPVLQLEADLDPHEAMDKLSLQDLWKFYYEASMLGKEVPLQKHMEREMPNLNGPSSAYYLPYLSAMQLFVPEELNEGSDLNNCYLCDVEQWPLYMKKHYEHFEVNPPWFRRPLYDMMDELSQEEPDLLTMKLKDLHPASWFCVAWYPLYRIPDAPLVTRFLTFHSFHPPQQETSLVCQGGSVPLAVYGLEWYNMRDELWMDNIKLVKDSRSSTPSRSNNASWMAHEGDVENSEQLNWLRRIGYLRNIAKTFARGLSFRRQTRHGSMEVNTYHHDFEYFYERN